MKNQKKLGALAFLPLIVFLALYVGVGLVFTALGEEGAFGKFPRQVALLAAIGVALLLSKDTKISEKIDILSQNMGNSGVMMMVLIYVMAGGFQDAAAAMGGKASVVNMALTFIPVEFLVPGIFLMCCFISTSIGTSMGTIAAMGPVAIGVAEGAGLNVAMVCAAVIGGSYFGDNLSMISDTTISAAQGCGSQMKDKFKMNFFIALPAAVFAVIMYTVLGSGAAGVIEAGAFDVIQVLPYFIVLITALMGMNVAVVLFIGILSAGAIGLLQGTVDIFTYVQAVGSGMSGMFSISIVAILISGIIGLIRYYGGVEWIVEAITSKIKSRKGAEYGIGLLSGILSASLVNNTIAIIISCPIAKEIGGKYNIAPKRLASLVDIFACAFIALIPHDGGILMLSEQGGVSPVEILPYSFYMFALIIAVCATIHFGLLRTKEEKENSAVSKEVNA